MKIARANCQTQVIIVPRTFRLLKVRRESDRIHYFIEFKNHLVSMEIRRPKVRKLKAGNISISGDNERLGDYTILITYNNIRIKEWKKTSVDTETTPVCANMKLENQRRKNPHVHTS